MKATMNMKVSAHNGTCSVGGMFIDETFLNGSVVKVSKESIRVEFTEEVHTRNGKEIARKDASRTEAFAFWKMLSSTSCRCVRLAISLRPSMQPSMLSTSILSVSILGA